mmetsp:Transcript_1382/g.3043  ORF Transcript_1382/g.3043 Transcript_1382/m.3043 type:complete len:308 (+) Transcript_1382:133-1056(+)
MVSFLQYRTPAFASTPSYYQRNHRSIPCIGGNKRPITQTQLHLSRSQSRTTSVNELADDDLVALPFDAYITSITSTTTAEDGSATAKEGTTKTTAESIITDNPLQQLRLCVVRNEQFIIPLIRHEDDVETDLFLDPRHLEKDIKLSDVVEYINSFNNDNNTQQTEPKETSSSSSSSPSNNMSPTSTSTVIRYCFILSWLSALMIILAPPFPHVDCFTRPPITRTILKVKGTITTKTNPLIGSNSSSSSNNSQNRSHESQLHGSRSSSRARRRRMRRRRRVRPRQDRSRRGTNPNAVRRRWPTSITTI